MIILAGAIILIDIVLSGQFPSFTTFAIIVMVALSIFSKSLTHRKWFLFAGALMALGIVVYIFNYMDLFGRVFYKLSDWVFISMFLALISFKND